MKMANNSSRSEQIVASDELDCFYEPMEYLEEKLILVGIFGTSLSLMGMVLNTLAAYVLGRIVNRTSTPLVYMLALAILDFFFLIAYILLFTVQIYFDYHKDVQLYFLWNRYLSLVFVLSKFIQTASTYLIVMASVERFIDVVGSCQKCSNSRRVIVVMGVLLFSIMFRGVSYWELVVRYNPKCSGFESLSLELTEMPKNPAYKYYSVYAINIVQVFLPFSLLLLLNLAIICRIRNANVTRLDQKLTSQQSLQTIMRAKAANLRSATRILVSVVTTYLFSNILNVAITFMEHQNEQFLKDHHSFYTFSVDSISLLYVITASTRLLIYIGCSEQIRTELLQLFRSNKRVWVGGADSCDQQPVQTPETLVESLVKSYRRDQMSQPKRQRRCQVRYYEAPKNYKRAADPTTEYEVCGYPEGCSRYGSVSFTSAKFDVWLV